MKPTVIASLICGEIRGMEDRVFKRAREQGITESATYRLLIEQMRSAIRDWEFYEEIADFEEAAVDAYRKACPDGEQPAPGESTHYFGEDGEPTSIELVGTSGSILAEWSPQKGLLAPAP